MRHLPASARAPRILHVLFSSRMAGSERYCVDLANEQAALGHEVHVAGTPGSPMAAALSPAATFHGFHLPFLRGMQLRHLISKLGVDIGHAHLSPACKALARAPASIGKVATLHVGYKPHQHGRLDGLICVNQAQSTRLAGYGGQSRVISNWLPGQAAEKRAATPRLRARLGIAADAFVVGAVGRLDHSKGMDVLVQAFGAVAPDNAALVILGEGRQRAALEKLRAGDPRIHLPGFCSDVNHALQDLDLFVSPSREESFGLAILEAMGAGLPLLSTAAEGPREILRGHPVELVEPGCVQALSAGLSREFAKRHASHRSRIHYDLRAFAQQSSVANISDFYGLVMNEVQRSSPRGTPRQHPVSHLTHV